MATLDKVKMALRISTTALDGELADLIKAAEQDLGIAGVVLPDTLNEICTTAIITYCCFCTVRTCTRNNRNSSCNLLYTKTNHIKVFFMA